jgi:putative endonuclease
VIPTGAHSATHLESGQLAESSARRFLQKQGLRLLASNYRCRYGELDLIMSDRENLVVIEIRYRRHIDFMIPAESITRAKRRRIARATLHFVQHNADHRSRPVRFDVLSVSGPITRPTMDWIPGAFTTEDLQVD